MQSRRSEHRLKQRCGAQETVLRERAADDDHHGTHEKVVHETGSGVHGEILQQALVTDARHEQVENQTRHTGEQKVREVDDYQNSHDWQSLAGKS
jgi:hypothetical protein